MTREGRMLEIRQAISKAKYISFSQPGRVSSLTKLIVGFAQRKGQNIMEEAAIRTAENLDRDIERYYGKELSFEEVVLAIDWGMHREFGEFSGLNVDRLCEFVRCYRSLPERADVQSEMRSQSASIAGAKARKDAGRDNWEAMLSEFEGLCRTWGETRTVQAERPAAEQFLPTARRQLTADCYIWLKTMGVITPDEWSMRMESEKEQEAAKILGREAVNRTVFESGVRQMSRTPVRNLAYSMMMSVFFRAAEKSGMDMQALLEDLRNTPEEERRYYGQV